MYKFDFESIQSSTLGPNIIDKTSSQQAWERKPEYRNRE